MPRAWLHTSSLSSDGFLYPDYSCQAFVGFNGEAPYLDNEYEGQQQAGYALLDGFYYFALTQGYNIHAALSAATQMLWQEDFCNTSFYQGLPDAGNMVVYGDGTLYIASAPRYLTINCDSGQGYTQPTSKWYSYGSNAQVLAWQYAGYYFDHWLVDGSQEVYTNPITVSMMSDHTIEAVYTTTPTYHWVTVNAYDYWGGQVDANIYIDGNYIGTGYASAQVTQGLHSIYCDDWAWSEYYNYDVMFMQFSDGGSNGQYYFINSESYLTAWYYP